MNKKCMVLALLMSTTVSLNHAFPSPKVMAKNAFNAVSTFGKKGLEKALRYKYVVLITAAVVAGGVLVYESDLIQEKIKKLLGIKKKGTTKRISLMPRHSRLPQEEEELKRCACECEIDSDEDEAACEAA